MSSAKKYETPYKGYDKPLDWIITVLQQLTLPKGSLSNAMQMVSKINSDGGWRS